MRALWLKEKPMPKYVTEERFDVAMEAVHEDISSLKNDLMTKLDGMTAILQRLDQERVFMLQRIERIETRLG